MIIELSPTTLRPSNASSRVLALIGAALYATIPPFLAAVLPALALKVILDLSAVQASGVPSQPAILERMLRPRVVGIQALKKSPPG